MTFTPNYIKMMQKSPVQKEWKPKVGDWYSYRPYANKKNDKIIGVLNEIDVECIFKATFDYEEIWLPTSDDWWERISEFHSKGYKDCFTTLSMFWHELTSWGCYKEYYCQFDSILELLSSFYHFEKWGLKWTGEEWRKE